MNRIHTAFSAALLASSFVGTAALAADQTTGQTSTDKADKTQVVPARDDLQPGAAPTVERMDDNVQRQHDADRDGSKAAGGGAAGTGAAAGAGPTDAPAAGGVTTSATGGDASSSGGQMAAGGGETRDWAAVDANSDNLISPEEMEEALKAKGPQAGQQR